MLSLKNKNILVTGGAGFIGSHLVDALTCEKPNRIVVVDNFFLGKRENLQEASANFPKLVILNEDASDIWQMIGIIEKYKVDVVFNMATKALPYSFVNPDDAYKVNVDIASVLLQLLLRKKYKTLIHCSSSEAYGSAQKIPIDENHPLNPRTLYAAGKAAADLMMRTYFTTYGLDIATVRPFNTYGPRQNEGRYAAIIPIIVNRMFEGKAPILKGDGKQTRDYIYVEDVARGIISAYKNKASRGEEINIATGREIKIVDLIKMTMDAVGYTGDIIKKPERAADVRRHKASIVKARKLIGFSAQTSFKDGIIKTVEWYRDNSKLIT